MALVEAAVVAVTGLSKLKDLAADTTDNITEKWYQASKDIEDFKELQTKLQRKSEIWKEALRSAGMSDETCIKEPLFDAIKCLEGEKKKIDRIQSNCCLLFMFRAQPFPPHLRDRMEKVVNAFDNVPNAFGERTEPARILEKIADSRPDSYQIIVDRRIVELAETQRKVIRHLDDKTGNQVVTLYGGAGSGKTSLAKSVAHYYQEKKRIFADGARFLSCRHNATVESICKELFQSLGISDVNTDSAPDAKVEQAFKSKGTPSEGQSSSMPLVKKLPRRLKERHLLIILDDVSEPELLKEKLIVPHAKDVKYLITSQKRDICDGATVVHMEPPTLEEALKILGNYIPNLPNDGIPDQFQNRAIQIIYKADGHPMTLATVGRQIDDFDDVASWNEVLNDFNELLSSEQATGDKLAISMLMAVDALGANSDAQKLLYLMAMCEPPYVPEVVLQLLYQQIDPEHIDAKHLSAFKKHVKNLKDRDFIVIEGKNWILSSTYQYFILNNKKEDVSELLCTLMKEDINDDDHELVRALCVLYIVSRKDTFTPAAALAMENAAKKFNVSLEDQNTMSDMKQAIEPLIYLLLPSKEGEECQIRRHCLVSKAIQQFISKQDLDDESFAQLLAEKDIYEDICEVLVEMAIVKNSEPILTNDTPLTLEELRFNLTPTSEEIVITVETLSALSHAANCDLILQDDCVLRNLLKILSSSNEDENRSTLQCLSALAQSSTAREKIASCEGLIEKLVAIFCKDSDITEPYNMMVKVDSIHALAAIALHQKTSTILVKTPDLLTSIARFLEEIYSQDPDHFGAVYTINCLLSLLKANDENEGDISKHKELMDVLTKTFETFNGNSTGDDVAQVALIKVLTLIDPAKYNKKALHSSNAFIARGESNAFRGLYEQALEDYKRADRIDNSRDAFYKMKICFSKAMLKDYKGALVSAKWAIQAQPNDSYNWQESGVVKELMGDYEGAKNDLNKALMMGPNDYEVLKHRAYVNFKLGSEEEAHEDAKKALKMFPKYRIDKPDYGQGGCLGVLSVPKFLDYELK